MPRTVAAFMLMLIRLQLIPNGWAQSLGPEVGAVLYDAYFTGYPHGYKVVRQLFPAA